MPRMMMREERIWKQSRPSLLLGLAAITTISLIGNQRATRDAIIRRRHNVTFPADDCSGILGSGIGVEEFLFGPTGGNEGGKCHQSARWKLCSDNYRGTRDEEQPPMEAPKQRLGFFAEGNSEVANEGRRLWNDIQHVLKGEIPDTSRERWAKLDGTNVKDYTDYLSIFDPGFELDEFQKRAVRRVLRRETVMGCAPTATGKTMIAYYAVANALRTKSRLIWTNPIKALSNQAFANLRRRFDPTEFERSHSSFEPKMPPGFDYRKKDAVESVLAQREDEYSNNVSNSSNIGILTGDVKKHKEAPVVVMTTEILHTMCLKGEDLSDVSYVVFDEAHYINDLDRGWVYEQLIEMLPDKITLVFLSATLKNDMEVANWIGRTRKKPVYVCKVTERPIPLKYFVFTGSPLTALSVKGSSEVRRQQKEDRKLRKLGHLHRFLNDSNMENESTKENESIKEAGRSNVGNVQSIPAKPIVKVVEDLSRNIAPGSIINSLQRMAITEKGTDLMGLYDSRTKRIARENLTRILAHLDYHHLKSSLANGKLFGNNDPRGISRTEKGDGFSENERTSKLKRLVETLKFENKLPAIAFILSKARIMETARDLKDFGLDLVPNLQDKNKIFLSFQAVLSRIPLSDRENVQMIDECMDLALHGIGMHHSGLLVPIKEIYEKLMQARPPLIRLLLATETVACGVDTPTRTVIFTDVVKPDGKKRRLLHGTEVMQMAGRAGRRGYDTEGYVVLCGFNTPAVHDIVNVIQKPSEPIRSRFKIKDQLVLSLLCRESGVSIEDLLRRSLCEGPKAHLWDLIQRIKTFVNKTRDVDDDLLKKVGIRQRILEINRQITPQLWDQVKRQLKSRQLVHYLDVPQSVGSKQHGKLPSVSNGNFTSLEPVEAEVVSPGIIGHWVKVKKIPKESVVDGSRVPPTRFDSDDHAEVQSTEDANMNAGSENVRASLDTGAKFVHRDHIVAIPEMQINTRNLLLEVPVLARERRVLLNQITKDNRTFVDGFVRRADVHKAEDLHFLSHVLEELRYKLSDDALALMPMYEERVMALKKLGFLTEDMKVTNIGRCAAHILSCDSTVLLTWLKWDAHPRTSVEFGSVVSSLVYPAWKRSETAIPEEVETPWESDVIQNSLEALYRASREIRGEDSEYAPNHRIVPAVYSWLSGASFAQAVKFCPDFEGNFVHVLQRLSELVRQLSECLPNLGDGYIDLGPMLEDLQERLRRGIVIYESIYLA